MHIVSEPLDAGYRDGPPVKFTNDAYIPACCGDWMG